MSSLGIVAIPEIVGGELLPMVTGDVIRRIRADFTELRPVKTWNYLATPRRQFVVASMTLAPRALQQG